MTRHSNNTQGASEWFMGAMRSHPEGLLLLAAGCALLLRSGASGSSGGSRHKPSQPSTSARHVRENVGQRQNSAGVSEGISQVSESISQAAEGAREYAADVTKTVTDKVGAYASAVGDYADDAWQQSERFAGQARNTIQETISRVVQEQPIALAVAGLAAGAAVAAAFPSTAVERSTLGQAGEQLAEAASNAGQQLSKAASKATEKLIDAAEDRGLSVEGLKEVASDAAGAFTGAFGKDENQQSIHDPSRGGAPGSSSGSKSQPGSGSKASFGNAPGGNPSSGIAKPGTTKQL